MGLDQYLEVSSETNKDNAKAVRLALGFMDGETHPPTVKFHTEVIYWRKAYVVSKWFRDNCKPIDDYTWSVTHQDLLNLAIQCRKALAGDFSAVEDFDYEMSMDFERRVAVWEYTVREVEAALVRFPPGFYTRFTYMESP